MVVAVSGDIALGGIMRVMKFISAVAVMAIISAFAVAQQAPAGSSATVKHVPITNTPSNYGKEMYNS